MKKVIKILLSIMVLLSLYGCAKDYSNYVVNKSFKYELDGFYGDFIININDDGTFTYYEGMASSYIGFGNWTVDNDEIILKDGLFTNIFKIEKGRLIWVSEGSTNFMYVQVQPEDAFIEK